jgi:hypothetical protein
VVGKRTRLSVGKATGDGKSDGCGEGPALHRLGNFVEDAQGAAGSEEELLMLPAVHAAAQAGGASAAAVAVSRVSSINVIRACMRTTPVRWI